MKKLYYILTLLLCSSSLFGQSPELMSYQAIIRNASDQLVVNQNVGIRISILQGSETGSTVYTETHTESTNDNGLVTLNIGAGNTSDDFSSIDWSNGTYFIKSETDPTGGTNYSIEGTSQLLSVPYALYAKNINTSAINFNDAITENKYSNFAFYDGSDDTTYAFNSITGTWVSQSGGYNESIIASNGNFAFYDGSDDTTYAFNKNTNMWIAQNGGYNDSLIASNGNFAFYDGSDDTTYVFNSNSNAWVSQSGGYNDALIASNGNFAFYDGSDDTTYAFSSAKGTWVPQSGGYTDSIIASNGNFAFYDGSDDTTYVFNKNSGTWISQSGGYNNSIVISESN